MPYKFVAYAEKSTRRSACRLNRLNGPRQHEPMPTMIGFKVTDQFRSALRAYAAAHDVTMTDLVRRVVAAEIGYHPEQEQHQDGEPMRKAS